MTVFSQAATLGQLPLFAGLTPPQLETLNAMLHRKSFATGAGILLAGQHTDTVYLILSGSVRICTGGGSASRAGGGARGNVLLGIVGPGEMLGEIHALDGLGHSADAIAAEPCGCLCMTNAALQKCLDTMPALACNLLRLTMKRLRLSTEKIALLSTQDVPGRLATQLLILARQNSVPSPGGGLEIALRLTQSDLAQFTGASRQSVNKAIAQFHKQGLVSYTPGRHFVLHHPAALAKRGA